MSNLFAWHTHRIFQAFELQRKHAVADQLLDDALKVYQYEFRGWLDLS